MNIYVKSQNLFRKKILIKIIFVIFLLIIFNFFGEQIRNYFYYQTSSFAGGFWRKGAAYAGFLENFLYEEEIKKKNSDLEEKNKELLREISLLKDIISDNRAIKEIQKNTVDDNFEIIPTNIIGLDYSSDFILIDKGGANGVAENMPVISKNKVIYGKIFKVYGNFSQVMLISNKNSVLDVKIQNDDDSSGHSYGAIKGGGGLSLHLDLVGYDSKIKKGDVLITSGLEGVFPSNLLAGKVASVNKDDLKPFQTAEIEPYFNIRNENNLFIVKNYLQKNQ